jgi:hypothetical protein
VPARNCLSADMTSDEAEGVRRGLLAMRQNVVLLRDPEDSNSFYPVSLPAAPVSREFVLSAFLVDPTGPAGTCCSASRSTLPPATRLWSSIGRTTCCSCTTTTTTTDRWGFVACSCICAVLPTKRLYHRSVLIAPASPRSSIAAGRAVAAAVAPHAASADGCH